MPYELLLKTHSHLITVGCGEEYNIPQEGNVDEERVMIRISSRGWDRYSGI